MNLKVGDRVEFILRSKKRVGTVEEVYSDTQKCKVHIDEFPVTVTKPQKYLVKAEEPELVVVPQFAGDWINHCKQREYDLACLLDYEESNMPAETCSWLRSKDSNQELIVRAWLDGYEVEKEPLYYVQLIQGICGYLNVRNDGIQFLNSRGQTAELKTRFTEKEIKAMDKGGAYWQFAVLVEELEE
ncbi:DUF1642 domain-containing protein [Listeria monocytogenes]|uniref:DUF1642 domain-containing protein n=2 Tax=Listeria monocytogenes TaxID=1639 RepID=UPI000BDF5F37|nr:DUF1642 domain-containing protein [Listeria monocytogenes]AVI19212.1 hypothetical protein C4881_02514 [Listeria monocytogenes]EAC6062949.1 DUF1642 domain-containing protein [Listeria monocytogenes]EAD0631848.1 DUF1642 domain-containing protein [Listeria monocytogenes]EAE5728771.1 DUF1642 domain-containing protein [Listeria monocytogenes]EAG6884912.1 DUF1642 domain-containing protein [Listeria monocytogenes]